MAYYTFTLKANTPLTANVRGKLIVVDSLGAANGVDITPIQNSRELTKMPGRKVAFKFHVDFDGVILQTPVDAVVGLFLSDTEVNLGFADGSNINVAGAVSVANDAAHAVPVAIQSGGTINVTATNVGINNTDANPVPMNVKNDDAAAIPTKNQALETIVDLAAVGVPSLAAVALVSDPTLRRLRIRNSHATAVIAIGGAGVTLANSPIRLQPGDVWMEDDAAGAAWYVISDTAGATVQLQGLK